MKNYSKQREEIINVIKELYNHPTAEEVYIIVKGKDPSVSRSTIYRNLGLLAEHGIINKITMPDSPDRYDYIREEHNHVICIKCNNAFDFNYNFEYENIKTQVESQTGVEINNKCIVLQGICNACREAQTKKGRKIKCQKN